MEDNPCTSMDADQCAEKIQMKRWTKDLRSLPKFSHTLLIQHLGVEGENDASRHKKLGYRLFKDRYVNKLEVKADVMKGSEAHFLIKSCVSASMKKQMYIVYVHLMQNTGEVTHGSCTCKAGKGGRCKHVAAVLFQILDYIELELTEVPDDLTCTQVLQQWHVPRGDEVDEPVLYEDMTFEKACYEKDTKGRKRSDGKSKTDNFDPTPQFARNITQDEVKQFANNLEQQGKAEYLRLVLESNDYQPCQFDQIHQNLPSKQQHVELMDTVNNINDHKVREEVLEQIVHLGVNWSYVDVDNVEFVGDLSVSDEKLREIERNTRGQSECDMWFKERSQRITSSNFGTIIKRRKNIYPASLMKTLCCSPKKVCPKPCKWGKDKEVEAVRKYMECKQKGGNSVEVCSACGFIVNPSFPWLGASPDFLVSDAKEQTCSLGLGEVKCPFSKRENTIEEACKDRNFFLSAAEDKIILKRNHAYFYQIQGLMATLQLQWCDFVVYTEKDLFIERIYFDNSLWEKTMVPELTSFYFQYVLPNLKST